MRPTKGQVVGVVSDGTGRSHQEVWMLAAGTAALVATVAAARGVIWVVNAATDVELWPSPPDRVKK